MKTTNLIQTFLQQNKMIMQTFSVLALIVLLSWRDLTRITAGSLYLSAYRSGAIVNYSAQAIERLHHTEWLDQKAYYAYNQEGVLWLQQGDLENAESMFSSALPLAHPAGPASNNLAVTYFSQGRLEQAAQVQLSAANENPNNAVAYYNLGVILMMQDLDLAAMNALKESGYIDPHWALPHVHLAFLHLRVQNPMDAEREARIALTLDDTQTTAYLVLIGALFSQNRWQDTRLLAEQYLQSDPGNPLASLYLAMCLKELQEYDAALQVLNQLLDTSMHNQEISRVRAEIEAVERESALHSP